MSLPPGFLQVVSASSDPDNPSPERIRVLVESAHLVAVVGLSRDPAKAARRVPAYMATKGYELIPVNPHATRLLGRRARASLDDVSEPVDMVLLFRPSHEVGAFVEAAADRPEAPAIWLQEGIRHDGAASEARQRGRTVVQDLCFYKAHRALNLGVPRAAGPSGGTEA